jgi:acetyl esterase
MTLDPRLALVVEAARTAPVPPDGLSVVEERALRQAAIADMTAVLVGSAPAVASTVDHRVEVGDAEITVRVYTPRGDAPFPAHLYLHGGGFWIGSLDDFDTVCRRMADGAGCVVASVDYRLAPEWKYPTQPEDCYAALGWLHASADALGVDELRLTVGGASAGGNLAAVVALMARDRDGPELAGQLLEVPVIDLTMSYPSVRENGDGYLLTEEGMRRYRELYLGDVAEATGPYCSPIFAEDLAGLPPALVVTAEYDPLRDEGEAYAARLAAAGVSVEVHRWTGQFHGSQWMAALLPEEARAHAHLVTGALRRFHRTARDRVPHRIDRGST